MIYLSVAIMIWTAGFLVFGRFIAPRWKVGGKLTIYLFISALLVKAFGAYSLLWIVGHQLLGVGGHIWWCRKNGIDWLTCRPRDKYLALRPWAIDDAFSGGEGS